MKKYESPELDIVPIDGGDIIFASGEGGSGSPGDKETSGEGGCVGEAS